MAAALRVILVLMALTGATFGQPDPNELVECFTDDNCQNDATPLLMTRRDCCVNSPNTFSFRSTEGSEACSVCVVFGFFQTEFTAEEQGQGYSLDVGFSKGRGPGVPILAFSIVSAELLGTTTGSDFSLQTTSVFVLPNQASRMVTFTFRVDSIAQELDESVRLTLSDPIAALNHDGFDGMINDSVYFVNTADLVIVDGDTLELQFTEEDYRVGEGEGTIPVSVNKNNRIATPVTIVVTPLTLDQHEATGRPAPPGTLPDDPDSPIEADGDDFNTTPIVVTFPADETFPVAMNDIDTPVPIVDDVINEATEQNLVLTVDIVNGTNTSRISITRIDSLGRIIDNDPISIGFERPRYNVSEPPVFEENIAGLVRLAKQGGVVSEQRFSVVVTVTPTTPDDSIGAAERSMDGNDNDYTIGQNNFVVLVLEPDQQTADFNFRVFPDDIAEGTEAFQAASTQLEGSPEFLPPTILSANTFVLIEDDDEIIIGFERNYTVNETDGTVDICAMVTFPADNVPIVVPSIILSVNTIPGTADETDYGRIAEQDFIVFLTFDDTTRRQCTPLTIIDDGELENTESLTIDLVPSSFSPLSSSVILDPDVTTVTILDDDVVTIGFIDAPYNASESDGTVNLIVGVQDGTLQREVVVSLSTVDGTALGVGDYEAISGLLLTFGPGVTTLEVPVNITNDGVFELTESFSATLELEDGPAERVFIDPSVAEVVILDEDDLIFGFNPEVYTVFEDIGFASLNVSFISGDLGAFEAAVFASSLNGTAIGGNTAGPGVDFISFDFVEAAVFSSGSPQTATLPVEIVDDLIKEMDEQFSVRLEDVTIILGGIEQTLSDQERDRITLQPSLANVTIVDQDEAVIGFLETEYTVTEGSGNVTFLIGVISGELDIDVPVIFETADGTALDGNDYFSRTENLVFTGNETQEVTVEIINDEILEDREAFFGLLSEGGAGLPSGVRLDPIEANATIIDDDPVVIGFQPDSYVVNEGDGSVTFTVSVISGTLDREVVIEFSTLDGTAQAPSDYTSTVQLLTFSSSVGSIDVSVPIEDDNALEVVETFSGVLNYNDPADQSQVTLDPASATVDILDNDMVTIGFVPATYEVSEEDADGLVDINVVVIEGELQRDVMVQFDTLDDSAVSGGLSPDYVAVLGRSLLFNAGTLTNTVSVGIVNDNAVEPREYFNATLTLLSTDATGVNLQPDIAQVAIIDNDTAIIGFVQETYDVIEDEGPVNVTVRLTGTIAKEVVVTLTTDDRTAVSSFEADFVTHSVDLTFVPGGQTEFTIPITIINDNFLEYDIEDFVSQVSLAAASDAIIIMPGVATINIIDDDQVVIGFDPNSYRASEGDANPPSFVVRVLIGELRRNVTVSFSAQDGTAIAGEDYQAIPDQTFTFNQGNTEVSIPVAIIDDNIQELDENFIGLLSTSDPDVILNPGNATYTIVNDDVVQFTFRQSMYLFLENGGVGTVCIDKIGETDQTVTLMVSGPLQAETMMNVDREVTFAPEDTSMCINFEIVDDIIALEETETFVWQLSILTPSPGVELGEFNSTTIGIMDNDELTLVLEKGPLLPENVSVAEACIRFSNPFARSFTIMPGTSSMNMSADVSIATAFEDYIPSDDLLTADQAASDAGELCYEAAVIVDDLLVEDQRQCFVVNFTVPEDIDMLFVVNNSAVCCIVDDDSVTIGFVPAVYSIAETVGEVFLTVELVEGQLERSVEVDFTTTDGTATSVAPVDFIDPGTITLQFSNSTTSQSVRVIIEDDDILEDNENFFGNLSTLDYSVVLNPDQAEVTILEDNDGTC